MWQWWFTDSYTPSKLQQLRHEVAKGHEKLVLSLWKETIIIYPANICNALTSCNNIEDLVEEYRIAPIFACIKQKNNNNKMSVCLYLSHVDVTSGISAVRPHCNTEIKPSILRCFQGKQKWMNLLKLSQFSAIVTQLIWFIQFTQLTVTIVCSMLKKINFCFCRILRRKMDH